MGSVGLEDQLEATFQRQLELPGQLCAAAGAAQAKNAAAASESAKRRARLMVLLRVFLISFSPKNVPTALCLRFAGGAAGRRWWRLKGRRLKARGRRKSGLRGLSGWIRGKSGRRRGSS